jgi:hypothetical protein
LRDDLKGLSDHLSFLLDHHALPQRKIQVELLSKDELKLIRSREWPLKELFEPSGLDVTEDVAQAQAKR